MAQSFGRFQEAHLTQCERSATIWASGPTRDPYFPILGASYRPRESMGVEGSQLSTSTKTSSLSS